MRPRTGRGGAGRGGGGYKAALRERSFSLLTRPSRRQQQLGMVRAEDEARDVVPALDKEQRRGAAVAEIEGGHFPAWKWRKSSFGDTELEPRPRQTCTRCLTMLYVHFLSVI